MVDEYVQGGDKDTITWEKFVIMFDHQYILERERHAKDLEFISFN